MAKKKNTEIFEALSIIEKEKGLPVDYMMEKITKAIVSACKNTYNNENVSIKTDAEKGLFEAYLSKEVVNEVTDNGNQISLEDAMNIKKSYKTGDIIDVKIDTKEFGRIAVMTSRNIIRQAIRDGERGLLMSEFKSYQGQIISAKVDSVDSLTGNARIKIGKSILMLPKSEQIPGETFSMDKYVKIYMVDVKETEKGPRAIISRSHPDFVKKLFENEVPEINDHIVEIKSISREAGSRTKIAVYSENENVDAVGTCIGTKGARVGAVVDELGGEKIDIVEYSEDAEKFISASLAPANVVKIEIIDEEEKSCRATVPDHQLSLAIGNKGQNVRLAARLTGWNIDIIPESGFYTGEEE